MALLKLNTARNRTFSFNGVSLTSLSVTISKDGAAFGAIAGTLSNITGNYYKLALTSGDTDTVGDLAYKFSDTVLGIISPDGEDVDYVGAPDVRLADNVAHGGTLGSSTATLALKTLNVTASSTDDAVQIFGGGTAINIGSGNGSDCLSINAAGVGISISSGAQGVLVSSGTTALDLQGSNNSPAISAIGAGTAPSIQIGNGSAGRQGILVFGNSSYPAMQLGDGNTGEQGLLVLANENFPAVQLGDGSVGAEGLKVLGNGQFAAVQIGDGTLGSTGLMIQAGTDNTDASGLVILGAGAYPTVQFGDGTNGTEGLLVQGAGSSAGIKTIGGPTNAPGLFVLPGGTAAAAHFSGLSTGTGLYLEGGTVSGPALAIAGLKDNAISISAQDGNGITIFTSLVDNLAATGISIAGAGTGHDINLVGDGKFWNNIDSIPVVNSIFSTVITEDYAVQGTAFTLSQALYEICQTLEERTIADAILTIKKRDGTTTAFDLLLDSGTAPTSQTRITDT